jgi:hypothetical protein
LDGPIELEQLFASRLVADQALDPKHTGKPSSP